MLFSEYKHKRVKQSLNSSFYVHCILLPQPWRYNRNSTTVQWWTQI